MIVICVILFHFLSLPAEVKGYLENDTPSESNLTQQIWHSYTFDSGVGNREELYILKVALDTNIVLPSNVLKWKSFQSQGETIIVGLGNNFILVTPFNNKNNAETYKEVILGTAKALCVFQKWDAKIQSVQSYVVVSISTEESQDVLKWYTVQNRQLKSIGDWPVHQNITHLDVVKMNHEIKLLIVSQGSNNSAISIYNFYMVPRLDIWLFEKIQLRESLSSLAVFSDNDNTYLAVSHQLSGTVDVWRYSKILCMQSGQKHFNLHQTITVKGVKSIVSFRLGFVWNVAVAGENSTVYRMGDDLLFSPVEHLNLGNQNEWMTVPVNTYRDDVLLISRSNNGVSALVWNGNEIYRFIKNFTGLVCRNDSNCSIALNDASLADTTSFSFNSHQNILLSSTGRRPVLVKLLAKLRPLPDEISKTLNELVDMKNRLTEKYTVQVKEVEALEAVAADEKSTVNSTTIRRPKNGTMASQTKNWSDTLVALDILKTRLNALKTTFDNLTEDVLNVDLGDSVESESAESDVFLENLSNGILFEGKIIINNLNVSILNGHDMNDLLENSYRKDRIRKISGTKTFETVKVDSLIFEKVNGIMGCDMVFSDDPWEGMNDNVINGDVLWESKLNILKDFKLMPGERKDHVSSTKNYETFSSIPNHTFDELHFEDLEITNETVVLKSINSRPMILPVHPAPLDIHYLDTVNQARIEVVNVSGNLTVDHLNGQNFTELMGQKVLKNNTEQNVDSIKIEGVLRVESLEPEYLNSVPIKPGRKPEDSRFMSFDDYGQSGKSRNQNYPDSSEKRNVYVFQDLHVDGKLITESLNNLQWRRLNNTLRKDVEHVQEIKGVKTFTKSLKLSGVDVNRINDENIIDKVMTDSSEQTIEFPQIFELVHFNNLTLNGTWDEIPLDTLITPLSITELNYGGNLTLVDGILLQVHNFHVTETINDIPLNDPVDIRKDIDITSGFYRVTADRVVVEGSLDTNNNINGVSLENLDGDRVSIKREQTIEKNISQSDLTLEGHLFVTELNGNDVASIVNSEGDTHVIDNFLRGQIRKVKRLLVKGDIFTDEKLVNSHDLFELSQSGVRFSPGHIVKGNVTFENAVTLKDLNLKNTINGLSLRELEEDVVMRHYHVFLNGTKTFPKLTVLRDVKAKNLNGHLMQDVVTLMGDHGMKGTVTINGNVWVRANVTATGRLNDVAVSELLKRFSTELNSYIYMEDSVLDGERVTIKNLRSLGPIQNVSFDDLMENVVYKRDCRDVTGRKSFTGRVDLRGNLLVKFVDNWNVNELIGNIVLVNEPGKIEGTLKMEEAILNSVYVREFFNSSLINDFDLNDWFEESVPLDGREVISGKMKFENPVVMDNIEVDLINGHMSSAIITLEGKQYIPVLGLFQRLNVTSDVSVGGNVNGHNLPEEYERTVLVTDNQTIENKMIFHKDVLIRGNLQVDEINGKKVTDLVTLDADQIVDSNLNLFGTVTVRGNIDNLKIINGIDLNDWYQRSVFLNRPQEIYGFWEGKGNVKAKIISGNAVLNNLDVGNVSKEVERTKMMAIQKKEEAEMEYYSHCHELEDMSQDLNKLPYLFQQFDMASMIETQSTIESIIPLKIAGSDYLMISFMNQCYSAMYLWDKDKSAFNYLRHVNIGPITKWLVTYHNNATFLVTSFVYAHVECEENRLPGNVWMFEDGSDKYVHLLSGNSFIDIVQENETADRFYTLEENGYIYRWTIKNNNNIEDVLLVNIGPGGYRFVDYGVFGGLAVSNGREVKEIKLVDRKIVLNYHSLLYGNMVALPLNDRVLVGIVQKDKIVVYENMKEEKVFAVVQTYRPGSVLWFNYGPNKQSFLIVSSHHKLIEIFEYESVSGFIKRLSLQLFSMKLQAISLPVAGKHQLGKFVVVLQKNKAIFLRADTWGDSYETESDSFC